MATRTSTVTTYDGQGNVVETRTITWETSPEQDNDDTLRGAVKDAMQGNRQYLALASPTNAQVVAQVRRITQQLQGVIRLTVGLLDGTD